MRVKVQAKAAKGRENVVDADYEVVNELKK